MRIGHLCLLALIGLITSCQSSGFEKKPKALGVPNQLTVICDQELWQTDMGDSMSYYLESVYPVLPRPEPLFDLKTFTPFDIRIEELRRELRTYLVCASAQDTSSETYKLVNLHMGQNVDWSKVQLKQSRDKWSRGQILLYFTAPTDTALAQALSKYMPAITEKVAEHDRKPITDKAYLKGIHERLGMQLDSLFDLRFKVPGDYVLATSDDSFAWLRKDFEDMTINILLAELPYTSQDQVTPESIKVVRDSLGKAYVESNTPGSHMVINDRNLPMYTFQKEVGGKYALQARGIWEMTDDFMGGPFVSYLVVRPERKTLLFMDAFVLAPGRAKRNLTQALEAVIESTRF